MKGIVHFFEIAAFAIRLSVTGNAAGKILLSNIRPVL
jgi:hypothetical protein